MVERPLCKTCRQTYDGNRSKTKTRHVYRLGETPAEVGELGEDERGESEGTRKMYTWGC